MPPLQIGQLLASITGEKSTRTTTIPSSRPAKRNADDEVSTSVPKVRRTTPTSSGPAKIAGDAPKTSRPVERSSTGYTGSARPSTASSSSRPVTERSTSFTSKKPSLSTNGKPSPTSVSFPNNSKSAPPSSLTKRPAGARIVQTSTAQPANLDSAKAPKKGSIAEIRARAAAQQEKLQAIGKIQHKATEKPLTKKEREEAAAEELKLMKKGAKPGAKTTSGLTSRNGSSGVHRSGNGHVDRERGAIQKARSGKPDSSVPVPKTKRSALATTGYTGSARPSSAKARPGPSKPGSSATGRDRDRDRGRPNPMGMFSKPRRRDEDDYDEDMDDFVVDDEEEEEDYGGYGSRYRYAEEEDESDMEAGFSDVEDEEALATRQAIIDDKREKDIEDELRRAKEARKRALLQGRR